MGGPEKVPLGQAGRNIILTGRFMDPQPPDKNTKKEEKMSLYEIMSTIDGFLWGAPYLYGLIGIGIILVLSSHGFVIRRFGHIMRNTVGKLTSEESRKKDNEGRSVSAFEALCVALGNCVGSGNISGVAAAIAVGGPGALLWMWIWAFFAMTVKFAEGTLASYYRKKNEDGEYEGGPCHYIYEGIGMDKGWKVGFIIAGLFAFAFFCMFLSGSQASPVAETLQASFGIPMMATTIVFCACVIYSVWNGLPRLLKILGKLVPWMCCLYILCGIIIIIKHIGQVPAAFGLIFKGAFTGQAATGGFVGATLATVVRTGVARAVGSNDAGLGTAPMVYARTNTPHPVKAGLWGAAEVFIDTIIICSITGFACILSGLWCNGETSMTLAISVFTQEFGAFGKILICLAILLFGFTTASTALWYYNEALMFMLRNHPGLKKPLSTLFKIVFCVPDLFIMATLTYTGSDFNLYWEFVNVIIWFPLLWNVLALLLLSPKFSALVKDYEARFLGKGTVDPNFQLFYMTEPDKDVEIRK